MNLVHRNARVEHICCVLPSNVEHNRDMDNFTPKEKGNVIKLTGIHSRPVLDRDRGQCLLDLFRRAGEETMQTMGWGQQDVQAVIVLSQTHHCRVPTDACLLQHLLDLSEDTICFDAIQSCSGYVYGLSIAFSYITSGLERILLFVGDATTNCNDPRDRSTALLFGEGASCSAVTRNYADNDNDSFFTFASFGSKSHALFASGYGQMKVRDIPTSYVEGLQFIVKGGGGRGTLPTPPPPSPTEDSGSSAYLPNVGVTDCYVRMDGMEIFNFALDEVPRFIRECMDFSQKRPKVMYVHQANKVIIDHIRSKFGAEVPSNIEHYGNMNSTSIPLLVCDKHESKQDVLMCGFGAGLSIACCVIQNFNPTKRLLLEPAHTPR